MRVQLAGRSSQAFHQAQFSCHELWFAQVHTRSQRCKQHLQVCDAIATLLKNKSLTSSNKLIYIVTHVTIHAPYGICLWIFQVFFHKNQGTLTFA